VKHKKSSRNQSSVSMYFTSFYPTDFDSRPPSSDEAEADVQSRIDAIQQNEIDQIREFGLLLDNELNFAEQYAQILRDVKDSWPEKCFLPASSWHSTH
jgi:hypothetical protein